MSKSSVGNAQQQVLSRTRKPVIKIIILGDSGVGKTSLLRQYVSQRFESRYKATIGADFFTKEVFLDGCAVNLQIWDTAGQERFQSLGSAFYRGADACMLVFDITAQETFQHVSSWLEEFTLQTGTKDVILVGNKSDLQEQRQVYQRSVLAWCAAQSHSEDKPVPYFEVSAKTSTAVEEAFVAIASAAFKKKTVLIEEVACAKSISEQRARTKKKKQCCGK